MHTRDTWQALRPLPYRNRTPTSSEKASIGRIDARTRADAEACGHAAGHGGSAIVILKAAQHMQEVLQPVPRQKPVFRTTIQAPMPKRNLLEAL